MANFSKKISETSVLIGECRFSYANVFAPRRNDDGTPGKYSVQLLIPKSNTHAKELIEQAVKAAAQNGVATKFNGKMPRNLRTPLRDGDDEHPDDAAYEGMWFMNCSSSAEYKPAVMVRENGANVEALDGDDFYSGCFGCAIVNFYAYNFSGNQGVSAGLNGVIKTRDGERLGGGPDVGKIFDGLEGLDNGADSWMQ